jgi:hypothetical protein
VGYSKTGYGLKGAVLPMMTMMMITLSSISRLVLVVEEQCVTCETGIGFLNNIF